MYVYAPHTCRVLKGQNRESNSTGLRLQINIKVLWVLVNEPRCSRKTESTFDH